MEDYKRLHQSLLLILDEIDRICRNNNIQYFLDSGTALGAIRHKGFIPWDDDADVGMLRDEYEKFIDCAEKQLNKSFFLHIFKSDNRYLNGNAKIRINNTYFPEELGEEYVHHGISVDIFPFDYIDDNKWKRKRILNINKQCKRLVRFKDSTPRSLIKKVLHFFIKPISLDSLVSSYNKLCIAKESNTLVCYSYRMGECRNIFFNKEDISPSKEVLFEDRTYMIMNNPDAYLRVMYNDYMVIPSAEKMEHHLSGDIIYGD